MGLEARCQITWKGETRPTRVHLDSAVVEVRGRPALKVPLSSIRRTSVRDGQLVLEAEAGTLVLALGDAASAEIISAPAGAAVVFYAASAPRDLERLAALRSSIQPDGAIWVVRTKGKAATVKEAEVMAAAKVAGLVDIKVVAFSETHSADKLVIPVAARGMAAAQSKKKKQEDGKARRPKQAGSSRKTKN